MATVPVIFIPKAPSSSSSTPSVRRDKSLTPHQNGSATTTQQQEWRPKPYEKGSDGADPTIGLTFVGVICVLIIIGIIYSHNHEKDREAAEKKAKIARRDAERIASEEAQAKRLLKVEDLHLNWRDEWAERQAEERSEVRIEAAIAHKKWLADAPRRKAEEDEKWAKWVAAYPYK